jgi:hypothetical protein
METINLYAGWAGILCGVMAGAVIGLFFHHESWLGGYASWPRRMLRLGHISFFGIGFINLAFALTAARLGLAGGAWASILLLAAAVGMPLVCFVSAFWKPFRNLFPVPVLCVLVAVAWLLIRMRTT